MLKLMSHITEDTPFYILPTLLWIPISKGKWIIGFRFCYLELLLFRGPGIKND